MKRPLWVLLLLALFAATLPPGPAAAFDLPGLSADSNAYWSEIRRRNPAGGATSQQRAQMEQRAATAERAGNWTALAGALEDRLAAGPVTPELWLALARAQLRRQPPEANRALQAAWKAFEAAAAGPPEIPSLQLMAQALQLLDRPVQLVETWSALVERDPDNARFQAALAEARRNAGMLVRNVRTDSDAEPARACIGFLTPPARRQDWQPADWVRTEPPVPGLAVNREGDALCLVGLPYGRTTQVTLRAGMPGEDGLRIARDIPLSVSIGNRTPRIAFDNRTFILPRGQEPRVSVATVNVSTLRLQLVRVTERSLVPLRNQWRLGQTLESYQADDVASDSGRVIWEGRADIPGFEANATRRTALPLPDAVRDAGPGLTILVARPGDGTRGNDDPLVAVLPLISTDLGLVAWRGADGLAVQARGLGDARARQGVRVTLLARNNEILGEATTDANGLARFGAPLLRGTGPGAPVSVHAEYGEGARADLAQLDLDEAAFDLSDRGATGLPHPGPADVFLWLDRGIYRPGETVNVAGLLRDGGGAPLAGSSGDLPVRLRVRRPNGQVFAETVPPRVPGAAVVWPVTLSATAPAGQWTVEALIDPNLPAVASTTFRVDAFVPERLAVTLGPAPGPIVPGTTLNLPANARFLYGAPGAGLTGTAELRLSIDPEPFADWRGWSFGQVDERFAPDLVTIPMPATDAQGNGTVPVRLDRAPDTTHPLRADLRLDVDQPDGRPSRASIQLPVRAPGNLIAVRPGFQGDAVDQGNEAAFEIAAVSNEGRAVAAPLKLRLVRERSSWRIVVRDSLARYETVYRDEPVDAADLRPAPGRPARFARRLPFGRYRLEVTDPNGLALTSLRFYSGWGAAAEASDAPDRVEVSTDRQGYAPGDRARVHIQAPFAGRASVAVLTDRLVSLREIDVAEGGSEIEVPVDGAWGPGAYVAVTVFRPGGGAADKSAGRPGRALGLVWVGLDPASRRLDVAIEGEQRVAPRQRITIPVRLAVPGGGPGGGTLPAGAMLTLAAVDEGILRLTNFATPDPVDHYLGRRRLGLDLRDDYGRMIPPAEGEATRLRQGGDDMGGDLGIEIPQRTVALFSGPVAVGPDGRATVTLDIPDFNGELRLMAVAWAGDRVGAGSRPLTVRDPVVAEALLPRFLVPGDEARLNVLLHNIDLPQGEVVALVSVGGGLELAGAGRLSANLAPNARALPNTRLRAVAAGEGTVRLAVTGPGGFQAEREWRITIRSSRPAVTEVASAELQGGRETRLVPPTERFLPNTWRASAVLGGAVRYDAAALLRAIEQYPFFCVEQAASRVLALALLPEEGIGGQDRLDRLNRAVNFVLDRQRYDGTFGLWSAQGEESPWVTVYAVEALLRAKAGGAIVPEMPLNQALRAIEEAVEEAETDKPEDRAVQAYRLHVMSLAGRPRLGAARRLLEDLEHIPTPLARAQLGAAFARAGDTRRAEQVFAAAIDAPARRPWAFDYGSATRDSLAVALLLQESGVLPDRRSALLGRLPGQEMTANNTSTQEQAWAVATAAMLGRDGLPARAAIDGATLPERPVISVSLSGPATLRNLGDTPLWHSTSVTGVPVQPAPAARAGMRLTRRFLDLNGQPLKLEELRQNTSFILLLEGRAETGETHQALVQQGLPAGWEIVSRLGPGEVTGMPWLGTLSEPAAQPALDDRYAAAIDLTPEEPAFRVAVRLRAVTPGRFELPGADLADMYRPVVFARQNSGQITVRPAE
ncbi:alpha-2-macroglobulin family protein [Roseomonas sp. NAR14]|uniref:Alpha-2-macroglobulin family protein n=1 Tax=Roseomonas acroporae TaxID=2937791 RepID=A0A9X2BTW4_9PROT|nr:alpha-2-macroglobulin [Roseomonas acroporae]MCK8783581.1 alpha-2-macroglobulin family protein [Roseomonas acroporae]